MARSLTLISGLLLLSNVLYANVNVGSAGIVPLRFIVLHRLCRLLMIGTAPFIHKKEER